MHNGWVVLGLATLALLQPILGGTLVPGADPDNRWRFYAVASVLLTWRWRWQGLVAGVAISTLLLVGSQLWPLPAWTGESRRAIEDVVGIAVLNFVASIVAGWIVIQWVRADDLRHLAERNLAEAEAERAARQAAEERYRHLVDHLPAVTYIDAIDDDSSARFISPQIADLTGYSPAEWLRTPGLWSHLLHPDDRERVLTEHQRTNATREPFTMEYRLLHRDGRVFWVRDEALVTTGPDGEPVWQGVMTNITTEREAAQALQEAESRFRTLVEQMPAMIYINAYDPPHPMLYVSPHTQELFGYASEQWMGDSGFIYTIVHPDDLDALREENDRSERASDQFSLEYRVIDAHGSIVWVRDECVPVHDADGMPLFYQGIMLDITARKLLEERLAHQAFHDTLTGLPNRALFMDRLEHAIARADRAGSRLAILYLDLDGFKRVNDTFGHAAGDELLAEVGQRLLASIRSSDTAARLGGDEFTLLIEDIDSDATVIQIADRIITSMLVSSTVQGRDVDIRTSIGIAFREPGSIGSDELLHRADTALYQAKHGGRGQYVVFAGSPARLTAGVSH